MVLYGIKVKNSTLSILIFVFDSIGKGESNSSYPNNYTCSFSKMIHYWRQTWNERTNGITDLQFPFGFVQVRFAQNHQKLIKLIDIFIVINKYQ
jgi:hypothetical protein